MPSKRGLALLSAAFVVATGAFWTIMLTSPPRTSTAPTSSSGVPVFEMMRDAAALPLLQADTI